MTKTYYITTPIYYVNDKPHIGHAYTSLACDVLARCMRLDGREVKFLTGTDEHGQKVEKSAQKAGKTPQQFTNEVSMHFQNLAKIMNFSHDDFIRTTEERHKKGAQALWQKLEQNGHIYLGKYEGWYSVRDEAFYAESELIDGKAPTGADIEWVEEPSYFFKLSNLGDKLLEYYEQNPDFIKPKSRRNEVISFVKSGLLDLSISRTSFSWGITVPGDEKHIMYVWLDALTNYISALGFPAQTADFTKFWPADLHIIGKDITRFHAIYWPAFLIAADITLPKTITAHGWWTNEGEKISKSLGNVIDPVKLVEEFGLDATRYFLMREINFGNDGNFARKNMILRINSELANNIGNLVQRTLSFIHKNANGIVPQVSAEFIADIYQNNALIAQAKDLYNKFMADMETQNIRGAIKKIIDLSSNANIYIDQEAPWSLRKTNPDKMLQVLYFLIEIFRYLAIYLQPFTPDSASKILDFLNVEARQFKHLNFEHHLKPGAKLKQPEPIFPRFKEELC